MHYSVLGETPEENFSRPEIAGRELGLNPGQTLISNIFVDADIREFDREKTNLDTDVYHLFSHGRPGELLIKGEWRNARQNAAFLKR